MESFYAFTGKNPWLAGLYAKVANRLDQGSTKSLNRTTKGHMNCQRVRILIDRSGGEERILSTHDIDLTVIEPGVIKGYRQGEMLPVDLFEKRLEEAKEKAQPVPF